MTNLRNIGAVAALFLGLVAACGPSDNNNSSSNGNGGGGAGGGDTGGGGSGGLATPDAAGPKDPSNALKAAIVLGSCVPDDRIPSVLNRIYTERGPGEAGEPKLIDYTECIASKGGGCNAVEACLGLKVDIVPTPCMPACNGDVFSVCDDSLRFTIDCAKYGRTCDATTKGGCVGDVMPGPTCDPGTFMGTCVNGAPQICTDTLESGPKCADYGLDCATDQFGTAFCKGTGAACTSMVYGGFSIDYDEGIACNGDKLDVCIGDGTTTVDCATLVKGFTCQTVGTTAFCGTATECDPTMMPDSTCEGDNVVLCNAGKLEKVDCKTLGFTGCSAMYGRCIPSVYSMIP